VGFGGGGLAGCDFARCDFARRDLFFAFPVFAFAGCVGSGITLAGGGGLAQHPHLVDARDFVPRVRQRIGEVAVVRQNQQP